MEQVECVVLGAGVVGLAVGAALARAGREVIVVEQHDTFGSETSARNSEVIHAGIYYPAGSAKARLCVRGKTLLYEHCMAFNVPYRRCGKIIVAAHEGQVQTVQGYLQKARDNGVLDLQWLEADAVRALEPEVRTVGGVLSPSTGVIDSHAFMLSLLGQMEQAGGLLALQTPVLKVEGHAPTLVHTPDYCLAARYFINCGGLHAPRFAADIPGAPRAYFAKGHYYAYAGRQPFSRLVYPVAEAGGLGVHVTMDLAGQIKFGPDVRWVERIDYAFDESHFGDFVAAIQQYYPDLDASRLHPDYTGIRPKIAPAEVPFTDFRIESEAHHGVPGRINLLGIESPGLTASLAIAEEVLSLLGR